MIKSKSKIQRQLEEQATSVSRDIAQLTDQFTDDSSESKFYLPTDVSDPIYIQAGAYASKFYSNFDIEEIIQTSVFGMFYLSLTYGFQVYLKEHSIKTNSAPFKYITDHEVLELAAKKIFDLAEKKAIKTTNLADAVFEIFLNNLRRNINVREFEFQNDEFNQDLFFTYLGLSLLWGYSFARLVIISQ